MNEVTITIIGNLTSDPEIRYTPTGKPVANFTVAHNTRTFDQATGQWKDGKTIFMRCTAWGTLAENLRAETHKGKRIMVTGTLQQREYETRDGNKNTITELNATEIGLSIKYAANTQSGQTQRSQQFPPAQTPVQSAPLHATQQSPWNTPPAFVPVDDLPDPVYGDEPPF